MFCLCQNKIKVVLRFSFCCWYGYYSIYIKGIDSIYVHDRSNDSLLDERNKKPKKKEYKMKEDGKLYAYKN